MKLLVDVGNTRIKWAWLAGAELQQPGALVRGDVGIADLVAQIVGSRAVEEVRLASVASAEVTDEMSAALQAAAGAPVRLAQTRAAGAGVSNGYREPRQLGVDRWLGMLAAYARYQAAVCVVDAGTAWTVDMVEADGLHLGGLIVPGPVLMHQSLTGSTGGIAAAVSLLDASPTPLETWGRDTEACIRNGARRAGACLVESCVKALQSGQGPAPLLVLTGGDAPELRRWLPMPVEHRPLLVLEGLALPDLLMRPDCNREQQVDRS